MEIGTLEEEGPEQGTCSVRQIEKTYTRSPMKTYAWSSPQAVGSSTAG